MQRLLYHGRSLISLSAINCRHFATKKENNLPSLIYRPNIMRWFQVKYQFHLLTRNWDPNCTEGSFIFGATQAICRVTEVLAAKANNDILEKEAEEKLMQFMTLFSYTQLNEDLKKQSDLKYIAIAPDDIKLFVPTEMSLSETDIPETGNVQKYCRIVVNTLAMKWQTKPDIPSTLVVLALDTIFERDFSSSTNQDWIINGFKIIKYSVLRVK